MAVACRIWPARALPLSARDMKPVALSIDLRVQHGLRDELHKAMEKYRAKAAAGAIIDVNTGEVVALASLPDFDPNNPVDALDPTRINRVNVGVYEMGSTFKALTIAMARDAGKYNINSSLDARNALRYGNSRSMISMPSGGCCRCRRFLPTPPISALRAWRLALASKATRLFCARQGSLTGL